jgi:hypothetical protein
LSRFVYILMVIGLLASAPVYAQEAIAEWESEAEAELWDSYSQRSLDSFTEEAVPLTTNNSIEYIEKLSSHYEEVRRAAEKSSLVSDPFTTYYLAKLSRMTGSSHEIRREKPRGSVHILPGRGAEYPCSISGGIAWAVPSGSSRSVSVKKVTCSVKLMDRDRSSLEDIGAQWIREKKSIFSLVTYQWEGGAAWIVDRHITFEELYFLPRCFSTTSHFTFTNIAPKPQTPIYYFQEFCYV